MLSPPSPRKLIAGTGLGSLTAASLVPSIPTQFIDSAGPIVADIIGPSAVGLIVYQSILGNEEVGLSLAWILVGYLTYKNAELLYAKEAEPVVGSRGFRILTAILTMAFGLGVWGNDS